jgi:WD40 repeat protein
LDLPGHTASISALSVSRSGALAASGSEGARDAARSEGSVRLWDLKQRASIRQLGEHDSTVHALAFSPDDRLLLSAGEDGKIKMYDLALQSSAITFHDHPHPVTALSISPDTTLIAAVTSLGDRHALHLYDLAYHARRQTLWPQLNSSDPATLGRWHALHHRWDWAADLLLQANARGDTLDPPLLARCLWIKGSPADIPNAGSPSFSAALANTLRR